MKQLVEPPQQQQFNEQSDNQNECDNRTSDSLCEKRNFLQFNQTTPQELNKNSSNSEEIDKNSDDPLCVCLLGLDKYTSDTNIMKMLQKEFGPNSSHPITIKSISKFKHQQHAFLEFNSIQDRQVFEDTANSIIGLNLKNRRLKVKGVKRDHPACNNKNNNKNSNYTKMKQLQPNQIVKRDLNKQAAMMVVSEEELQVIKKQKIEERVCPLWETQYEEQISIKTKFLEGIIQKIYEAGRRAIQLDSDQPAWIQNQSLKVESVLPCQEKSRFHYRNKSEMNVGYDPDGKVTVGFIKGNLSKGVSFVEPARFNVTVSMQAIQIAEALQQFIILLQTENIFNNNSEVLRIPYDKFTHQGFWRYITIRQSFITKQIIVQLVCCKENLIKGLSEQIANELIIVLKQKLCELFFRINTEFGPKVEVDKTETQQFKSNNNTPHSIIQTCYSIVGACLLWHDDISDNIPSDNLQFETIFDVHADLNQNCSQTMNVTETNQKKQEIWYEEEIMNRRFRVSMSAFLQVNTPQCNNLYKLVQNLASIDQNTVFLDVCSGIGTIGICLASHARKVISFEMVPSANIDAEYNAYVLNLLGKDKFESVCGKVEDTLQEKIKLCKESLQENIKQCKESQLSAQINFIGVVDPPRSGLHPSVLKTLRTCKGLDTLIYVSCNPTALVDNLMALCLPVTKHRKGPPFSPLKLFGVDLFPQTSHVECVVLLKRLYE